MGSSSNSKPEFVNYNGALIRSGTALLTADNRGFRYGDGLFETIKLKNGQICLENFHFERLMGAIALLGFKQPSFTPSDLALRIRELCALNGHSALARVRLTVFRGDGSPQEPEDLPACYIIQTSSLATGSDQISENGLRLDLFPAGRKSCDPFSNLKSGNYLLYVMASLHARREGLNDCLVLNSHGRIADSTIANVFYGQGTHLFTPPLSEGCVAGVMRRSLIESLTKTAFTIIEKQTTAEDLLQTEGLFLTNAIRGIQWVGSFQGRSYSDKLPRAVAAALAAV